MNLEKIVKEKISTNVIKAILEIAEIAEKNNFRIYLVGGIVRDLLLDNPIKDYDLILEGDALSFCQILKEQIKVDVLKIQPDLHTCSIIYNGINFDIASTREEIYLSNGQLPKIQKIGCLLSDDVKRRDFTINSMYISLNSENQFELIDFIGGYSDLKDNKIKILHSKSFYDDPSRIVRAYKFALRLNFDLDSETKNLAEEYFDKPIDKNMPISRIMKEFRELLGLNIDNLYKKIIDFRLYHFFFTEIKNNFNYEKVDNFIKAYKGEDKIKLLFLIMYAGNKPIFDFTKDIKNSINALENLSIPEFKDNYDIRVFYDKLPEYVQTIFSLIDEKSYLKYKNELKDVKLNINGRDLEKLGIPQGEIYSKILTQILAYKLNNNRDLSFDDELKFAEETYKNNF